MMFFLLNILFMCRVILFLFFFNVSFCIFLFLFRLGIFEVIVNIFGYFLFKNFCNLFFVMGFGCISRLVNFLRKGWWLFFLNSNVRWNKWLFWKFCKFFIKKFWVLWVNILIFVIEKSCVLLYFRYLFKSNVILFWFVFLLYKRMLCVNGIL